MGSEYAWAVDALVIVLLIISAYLAMVRGFFREIFALASWIIAFLAAFFLAPTVQPLLADIPGLGGWLSDCEGGMLAAFIIVFGAALIVTGLIIWLFSSPTRNTAVSVIDQGLGFIYGALRGLILVAVLLIAYQEIVKSDADRLDMIEAAAVYPYVEGAADVVRSLAPERMPAWLTDRLEQMKSDCEASRGGL